MTRHEVHRSFSSFQLIHDVLQLFNRLLTMKSIPVVQQVYQAILADMTLNFNVLLQALQQKTLQLGTTTLTKTSSDLSEDNAEAALVFDCSALCQIGNIKGNLIGVRDERRFHVSNASIFLDVRVDAALVRAASQATAADQL